jgi:hypothetical protein
LYAATMARMKERAPNMPDDQMQEIAQAECLMPVNPNWEVEKPLTKAEKKALADHLKTLKTSECRVGPLLVTLRYSSIREWRWVSRRCPKLGHVPISRIVAQLCPVCACVLADAAETP